MARSYFFHPEALLEYAAAANYYHSEATPRVAEAFAAVEVAIRDCVANPESWRVIQQPDIRRYALGRFPFALYYRWEPKEDQLTIYAIMHCSREPGCWQPPPDQNA